MLRNFETIKKSPFLNGNFLLSSPSANVSAEIWEFKIQDSKLGLTRGNPYFVSHHQHVIPPSVCEDWNLYPQFIA